MAISLPEARNMFGRLKNEITPKSKSRVYLSKGSHQALDDFQWIAQDLTSCPTHIVKNISLSHLAEGHRDASGKDSGGVWFPGDIIQPQEGWHANITDLWHVEWPEYITRLLVLSDKTTGTITKSDL